MRIQQALAILRRTGFIVLVAATTVAKAQCGLAFSKPHIHGRIDPSVQLLERWNSPAAPRELRELGQAANWQVALARLDTRQLPPIARYAAPPHAARPAARAQRRAARPRRSGRARSAGRKARRAGGTTRRSTRVRRRGEPEHARRNGGALCEAGGRNEGHTYTIHVTRHEPCRPPNDPMPCTAPAVQARRSRLQRRCQPLSRRNEGSSSDPWCATVPATVCPPPAALVPLIHLYKEIP
jgi:hypothetical protein